MQCQWHLHLAHCAVICTLCTQTSVALFQFTRHQTAPGTTCLALWPPALRAGRRLAAGQRGRRRRLGEQRPEQGAPRRDLDRVGIAVDKLLRGR